MDSPSRPIPTDPAGPGGVDINVLFGGSATKGEDYEITGGNDLSVIHFDEGEFEKEFTVTITDDDLVSPDEVLQVNLSGATNATIDGANSQTAVTIENDDGQAFFEITDVVVGEGGGVAELRTVVGGGHTPPTVATAPGRAGSVRRSRHYR